MGALTPESALAFSTAVLVEKAKADSGVKAPKTVDIYVRPEINMVYYVIDGETFGNFELC